jgi:hypothetical protein
MKNINHYNLLIEDKDNYTIQNLGEAMQMAVHKNTNEVYLINLKERKAIQVIDKNRTLVTWGHKDIDYTKVNQVENNIMARMLSARYVFKIGPFIKGLSMVEWMLCPAGLYHTDDEGFDMEDVKEVYICAIINKKGKIIVPFQPMTSYEADRYRQSIHRPNDY